MKRDLLLRSLVMLALAGEAFAAGPPPRVRAEVVPRQTVVGSPLRLRVSVLVPTWFTRAPDYPSFELPGLVVRLPADSSYNVREVVDGVGYSGIVREYLLYPQRAATYLLGGQVVRVHYAHPETRRTVDAALPLGPIRFRGIIPGAAADLDPFLSTDRLVIDETFEGNLENPKLGDALTRTIEIRVRDLPAMFVPPVLQDQRELPGLRVYARSPITDDVLGEEAGRSTGIRIESVTYVIEEAGQHVLPPIGLRWWNPRTQAIETTETDGFSFEVDAPASGDRATDSLGASSIREPRALLLGLAVAVVAAIAMARRERRRYLVSAWRRWRDAHAASEPVAFRRLARAVRRGEPRFIQEALNAWLRSIDESRVSLASLPRQPGCEALARCVRALESTLYAADGDAERPLDRNARAAFREGVREARESLRARRKRFESGGGLPALNPE